ncbi:ATP-binding cassette domain-containing protein [Zavarzinia sp.]|uniref:ATP-binding cassette domain-containing protein n=1 Tax=Zavarzinia sp. TaxID=2027920 RepID=UPI0035630735
MCDLSITIGRGEFVCLIGPSGCGKSTALRLLLGLDRDFEGAVTPDPRALSIGVMFQEPRLLPWRTVAQNIALVLPRRMRRDPGPLLAEVGLAPWRDHYPGELSLGLARRAALARALAVEPALLVLDEPFVSLDEAAAAELRGLVARIAERRAMSVLMVTHNIGEALALADRLILLTPAPGRLLAEVPLETPRVARGPGWTAERRRALAGRFATIAA